MRTAILALILATSAFAQTAPPQQASAPDRAAYQAALKTYNTQAGQLRARAKTALAAEAAREKSPPCPNAVVNVDIDNCFARERNLTQANYKAFTAALHALLALPAPAFPGMKYPMMGPSGAEATPATGTAAFDKTESAWHAYARAECDAEDVEWRGGTIVNFMDGECELRLARDRLRELRAAYDVILAPN